MRGPDISLGKNSLPPKRFDAARDMLDDIPAIVPASPTVVVGVDFAKGADESVVVTTVGGSVVDESPVAPKADEVEEYMKRQADATKELAGAVSHLIKQPVKEFVKGPAQVASGTPVVIPPVPLHNERALAAHRLRLDRPKGRPVYVEPYWYILTDAGKHVPMSIGEIERMARG